MTLARNNTSLQVWLLQPAITPQAGKRLVVTEEDDTATKPKKPRPSVLDTIGRWYDYTALYFVPYRETLLDYLNLKLGF